LRKAFCLLVVLLVACGTEEAEKECRIVDGEYIVRPEVEINTCGTLFNLPSVMFLETSKLDEEQHVCGEHILLEDTFQQLDCTVKQRKTLKVSDQSVTGLVLVEAVCPSFKCMTYWSLKFRRIEDEE
jgi:hypothetical protein